MVKRLVFFIIALLLLLSFTGCSSSSVDKDLIGEWKMLSHEYDKDLMQSNRVNGLVAGVFAATFPEDTMIIFKNNNTMEVSLIGMQMDYKVEDNKIFLKDNNTGEWSTHYLTYTVVDSNTMTWNSPGVTFKLEKNN